MDLNDIMNEWIVDSAIDPLELGEESIKTGKIHAKYAKLRSQHRLIAKKALSDYRERKEWWRKYYRGDFNNPEDLVRYGVEPYKGPHVNVEIDKMLESNEDLIKLLLKKEYHEEVVEFCEAVLTELRNRTFAIGNTIKWNIFVGGG